METPEINSFEGQFLLKWIDLMETKVPELRYLNQDLGQLEYYEMGSPAVNWPCALIDMSDTQYADLHNGIQEANTCVVVIRIGFNPYSNSSNLSPDAVKKKALYYHELEDKVYRAMQGWTADDMCSPLTRIRKTTEKREDDAFRVRLMVFTTAFEDNNAKPDIQTLKPAINLDIAFGEIEEDDD